LKVFSDIFIIRHILNPVFLLILRYNLHPIACKATIHGDEAN